MPSYPRDDDPQVVIDQLYSAMQKTLPGLDKIELSDVVSDIRINTTIQGASTLEVDLIDPEWVLLTSGVFDAGKNGRLKAIDLNYPVDSNYWWRLTTYDVSTDRESANLTLTFEDRIVSYCREKVGAKSWSRAQFTRAQAIRAMTADAISGTTPKPIFVSPELNDKQTIEVADE